MEAGIGEGHGAVKGARIAIVGSGPAGCYAAERLAKLVPDGEVDVLDRLPAPFGLIRYGVAPDHQGTKGVARVLSRVLSRPPAAFFGNVELGRDVGLDELRALYDAVVLAVGAPLDRRLGVPGEDLPGVSGSGAFVGWYNGHPDHCAAAPDLSAVRRAVVVGNGNVALDVARVLAKSDEELKGSDLSPEAAAAIAAAPLEEVVIVGRRGAAEARFSPTELEELGRLARARPTVRPDDLPAEDGGHALLPIFRRFAGEGGEEPMRIRFRFGLTPDAFLPGPDGRLGAVRFRTAAGGEEQIPAQLCVTCIGYRHGGLQDLPTHDGAFRNEAGRIADRLYVVGWAKRGPSGTIPTNRSEAHAVAEKLVSELQPSARPGREGLRRLLAERGVRAVDFAGWQRLEAHETAAAVEGRVRAKVTSLAEMLEIVGRTS